MAPILYGSDMSPPVRAVLLTSYALDLELDFKEVNLMEKEHLTPEFLKMNPQHTIPTLDDDGYYLWDSHAIAAFLVNKYGDDDTLYPQDPQLRGTVDQRLHFNSNVISPLGSTIIRGIIFNGDKSVIETNMDKVLETYGFLETFLEHHDWLAGETVTIADLCTIPTISTLNTVIPVDGDEFPKLAAWLDRCAELPYYSDGNAAGLEKLSAICGSINIKFYSIAKIALKIKS